MAKGKLSLVMRDGCVAIVLIAAVLAACAGSDAAEAPPAASTVAGETRSEIGPRALDVAQSMMMVVDSVDVSGEDIFVRVRVVNGSDQFLNVEADGSLYGPLLVVSDDRGNTYRARAVEPAGVDTHTVGGMRFRVDGPFDPDADEFTVEIATSRGRLVTDPIAAPTAGLVRWLTESPAIVFSDLVGSDRDGRTVQVFEMVDRGSHLDVSVKVRDASAGFSIPNDVTATLTSDDGTELESLPVAPTVTRESNEFTGVLRFLGRLPADTRALSLSMVGIDVEMVLDRSAVADPDRSPTTLEPPFAVSPRLPDLLHFDVHPEPLPATSITT